MPCAQIQLTNTTGGLSVHIGLKSFNLKSVVVALDSGIVGSTTVLLSNISVNDNIITRCHARLSTSATTFGSTANGGAVSVFAGSSGLTRISAVSIMGGTAAFQSNFSFSRNTIVHCMASGNILFGRSNGADVRGGGISFFIGFTTVSFLSANWVSGSVSLVLSSVSVSENVFSNCGAVAESDSFAFASSAHGGAASVFIGSNIPCHLSLHFSFVLGALSNALSSQKSVLNQSISLEQSYISLTYNVASNCSVSALHVGEEARFMSSGALGGAFGVYFGASSHATSSEALTSVLSGGLYSRSLNFSFENNTISSCSALLNVSGRTEVATATGGALAFQFGFFSFSQVVTLFDPMRQVRA